MIDCSLTLITTVFELHFVYDNNIQYAKSGKMWHCMLRFQHETKQKQNKTKQNNNKKQNKKLNQIKKKQKTKQNKTKNKQTKREKTTKT